MKAIKHENAFERMIIVCFIIYFLIIGSSLSAKPVYGGDKHSITLRYGSYVPKTSLDDPVIWFIDQVSKKSGIKINFDTYYSGILAKPADCLSALGSGVYDLGWISPAYTPGELPFATITASTPLVGRSLYSTLAASDELTRNFEPAKNEYIRSGVQFLFNTGVSHYDYIGTKQIKSIGDIKGVKARTYGYFSKVWSMLDGVPVSISISEAYDSLQKGVVDGVLSQPNLIDNTFRLTEVAKYFTKLDFGCLCAPVIINLKTYQRLPEKVRNTMMDVAKEMPGIGSQLILRTENSAIEKMIEKGVTVSTLSDADQKRLKDVAIEVSNQMVDDLASRGINKSREAMDLYLSLIEKNYAQQ